MPTARIVEPVYVFEDHHLGPPRRFPRPPPDRPGPEGFEQRLHGRIVIAIALTAHGRAEAMLAQDLLVVRRAVLADPVAVEDAAFGWRPEGHRHFLGPDRQVTLHAVADGPTNYTPEIADRGSPPDTA